MGVHRVSTETSEETVVNHYLQPAIDKEIRSTYPELAEAAIEIKFTFV